MIFNQIITSSLILAIISFLIYWYGFLYNSPTPDRDYKEEYYVSGILFIASFIIVPLLMYILLENFYSKTPSSVIIIIFLMITFIVLYQLSKLMGDYSKAVFNSKQQLKHRNLLTSNYLLVVYSFIYTSIPATYIVHDIEHTSSLSYISMLIIFLYLGLMSALALLAGLNSVTFPRITIETKNKSILSGILLKRGNHFVQIVIDNKIMMINIESIFSITEEHLLRDKNINSRP